MGIYCHCFHFRNTEELYKFFKAMELGERARISGFPDSRASVLNLDIRESHILFFFCILSYFIF